MTKRRKTKTVTVGKVKIGSGHPVVIQSMTKTSTSDAASTARQIRELEKAGCEIVRVAVKTQADAKAIPALKREIAIPLVADIHFNYKLAVEAVRRGADKIRINPGNIAKPDEVDRVIDAAYSAGIPIRIGINSGSLPKNVSTSGNVSGRMVSSMMRYLKRFRKRGFDDLVLSIKASEVPVAVAAYRKLAAECEYPLHLGITAAGLPEDGIVKNAVGIGSLLADGIGDTVRVSLTGPPAGEVHAAKRILSAVGTRRFGPQIIACPMCGRCQVDLIPIIKKLEKRLGGIDDKSLSVAIMGCEVNGPGEAKEANIGIAFGSKKGAIFRNGKIIKTVKASSVVEEILKIIDSRI